MPASATAPVIASQVSATAVPTQCAPVITSQVAQTTVPPRVAPTTVASQVAPATVAFQVAPTTLAPSPSVAALPLDRFLELVREEVRAEFHALAQQSSQLGPVPAATAGGQASLVPGKAGPPSGDTAILVRQKIVH